MNLTFSATSPSDLPEVQSFLLSAFGVQQDAPVFRPGFLQWKYFEPIPDWHGSRAFVLRGNGRVIAHCAVYPVRLLLGNRDVTSLCPMDWASRYPGAGASLSRRLRLMELAETAVVTGGSKESRTVIPHLGFSHYGDLEFYARVVRPWKQFRSRPREDGWRDPARFLRNFAWSWTPSPSVSEGWSVVGTSRFREEAWFSQASAAITFTKRDPELLNYWLRCPIGTPSGFLLFHEDQPCGHVLMNKLGGQARIIDIRVAHEDLAAWQAAFALATRVAIEDRDVCEILAVASTRVAREALLQNGFRFCGQQPIYLYDPGKILTDQPALHWNLIDGDTAIIHDPRNPYNC